MKLVSFLTFCLSASTALGSGGSIAGNGGGLAEKNVIFAFSNMERFVALCLETPSCRLSEDESNLLRKIKDSLAKEKANANIIRFENRAPPSNFFKIEGLVRVAKTGDRVGDTIYINSVLLYQANGHESTVAMSIPLATAVLVHELGHHQGVKDHSNLDQLGTKLEMFLLTNSERSEFWNGNAALTTVQLNSVHSDDQKNNLGSFDQLILENGDDFFLLNDKIQSRITCPKLISSKRPQGFRIYNLHGERGVLFDKKTQILEKPFRAWYISSCEHGEESDHGDIRVTLKFKKNQDGKFTFLPEETGFVQISCADKKEVCQ